MNRLTQKKSKGRKRRGGGGKNNQEEWEDREIEEEGTHPYHERYTKEGIVKK